MKVLHIGPKNYPPNHGGVERVVYDLVQGMPDVESHIFVEWPHEHLPSNVQVLPVGLMKQLRAVLRYAGEHRVEIIHLHKTTFIPLALLLRLAGRRCVLTIHGCQWRTSRWPKHICAAFFLLDCLGGMLLPNVVFVGERDWRLFSRLLPWKTGLHLVRNGVRVESQELTARNDGMVYLGRLSPEKNIVGLIRAAQRSQIPLDLYGPFDPRDTIYRLEVLKAVEGGGNVTLKGPVSFERVQHVLSQYKVFVSMSFFEGLPVSVLEAAAAGLYLVLSDIPEHRLLRMPQCMFVPPANLTFDGLAIHAADGGRLNREHVAQHFDIDNMIDSYKNIYRRTLS
jgi:glycosyltransferase involved in cell wall biosynthesis